MPLVSAVHSITVIPVLRFLVGDGARFITGQTLSIDGGLLMVR
jgi:NAD(P)-dependent dehydrogenase (short-subunit alcohol dehydrogenase family)